MAVEPLDFRSVSAAPTALVSASIQLIISVSFCARKLKKRGNSVKMQLTFIRRINPLIFDVIDDKPEGVGQGVYHV